MTTAPPPHPLGSKARVLLSSVFGPYARDDEYGSRSINPMELYHNQVTRVEGAFSLRMFHRSFGLMLLQANIDAPCTLLDFPTLDRFVDEIRNHHYDVVGISAIVPNVGKVEKMCALVREHLPQATIVVGGHVANKPGIDERLDADHVVKGDGVRWFRELLGADLDEPVRHPVVLSGLGTRALGINMPNRPGNTAAVLLPSVGCPVGCNFCCTSAMFGGKGKSVNFYDTGDELFSVMCQIESKLGVRSFFIMDENFLLHRERALRLLELMEERGKSWALYVFSSARVLQSYSIEQLVGLGVSWAWMGVEGEATRYHKLRGVDTRSLVRTLQSHGIRVLGSTIIGMEDHTPSNIDDVIDYAVSHDTDFHQFMLYTRGAGTELYEQHSREGTLLPLTEWDEADAHGQYRFNYRHPHIRNGEETEFLLRAFRRDYEVNGPSLARVVRTTLRGWTRYRKHPDRRIRERFAWEAKKAWAGYGGLVWAARDRLRHDRSLAGKLAAILQDVYGAYGWKSRIAAPILGRVLSSTSKREERRLAGGATFEPPTIYEENAAAAALARGERRSLSRPPSEIQWVTCTDSS